jgi:hypothetical protein
MSGSSPEGISWKTGPNPAQRPKVVVIFVIAILVGLIGWRVENWIMGLVGFAVIAAATAEFWLGTTFRVNDVGAEAKTGFSSTKIEWANVVRVVTADQGIKLSPLAETSRTSPFRGVFLRYGAYTAEELMAVIRPYCGDDVRFLDERTN